MIGSAAKGEEQMIIRQAKTEDVLQIAEILVEDWQTAYRGIMNDDFLDSLSTAQRYEIEIKRYQKYVVAADENEILGYAWSEEIDDEAADCEIVALYVRYAKRKSGIGRALMQHAMDNFRKAGKKTMIVWCLKENHESRKFYVKMGGKADQEDTHRWGGREYAMISYLYQLDEHRI